MKYYKLIIYNLLKAVCKVRREIKTMVIIHGPSDVRHGIRWFSRILSFNIYNKITKLTFYKKVPFNTEKGSNFSKTVKEQN